MNKKLKGIVINAIVLNAFLLFSSCSYIDKSESILNIFDWLRGTWEFDADNGLQYESWEKINDTLFAGISYQIVGNDTIVFEKLKLQIISGELFYVPQVSNQNNGKEIYFKFQGQEGDIFTFENKTHDFPQRIIYQNKHKDTLLVFIEGLFEGNEMKFDLVMKRKY